MSTSPFASFSLSVLAGEDAVVLAAAGDLDLATADRVAEAVRALRTAGRHEVVLDLRGVQFIDSTGLRTLLALRDDARRDGHRLLLVEAQAEAQRIFGLTGTQGLFDWCDPRTP